MGALNRDISRDKTKTQIFLFFIEIASCYTVLGLKACVITSRPNFFERNFKRRCHTKLGL